MKHFTKEMDERYFIGIEYEGGFNIGGDNNINQLWNTFLEEDIKLLADVDKKDKFIGLECYAPDVMETKKFDYYAMVETNGKVKRPGFSTKKLPKGRYIFFEVKFDEISKEIQKVYEYIKENSVKVHMGFDFEDYITGQNYREKGAIINFALLLENDN